MMAYYWALQAARAAASAGGKGGESAAFYLAKVQTAEFYFERLLPRADAHRKGALAPAASVMRMDNDGFAFD